MYAELQRMVEQSQAELVEAITTKQREAERHAQEMARGLENELSQLRRRSSELEAHTQTQDKILFLQVQMCPRAAWWRFSLHFFKSDI